MKEEYTKKQAEEEAKKKAEEEAKKAEEAKKNGEGETHTLSRSEILNAKSSSYNENDYVKWDSFYKGGKDVADGVIPVKLLDDPVYTSMNLPSETRSVYMEQAVRDNGHIYDDTSNPKASHIIAIGSVYATKNATLANNMKVCLGKIKLFGFNKNTKSWEIIQEDPHIAGCALYDLPWTSNTSHKVPIQTYSDHLEITLSANDFNSKVLHFWGKNTAFDKTKYSYYATAYTFWCEGSLNKNSLTAVSAIDIKSGLRGAPTIGQLNSSRGMAVTSGRRTIWSTTIPNDAYKAEWGTQLQKMYDKDCQ